MKIPIIVVICILVFNPALSATPYEVLVVDIAKTGNREQIEEFEKASAEFGTFRVVEPTLRTFLFQMVCDMDLN